MGALRACCLVREIWDNNGPWHPPFGIGELCAGTLTMQQTARKSGLGALILFTLALVEPVGLRAGQPPPSATTGTSIAPDRGTIPAGEFRLQYRVEGEGRPAMVIGSAVYYPRIFSRSLRKHLRWSFWTIEASPLLPPRSMRAPSNWKRLSMTWNEPGKSSGWVRSL